MKFSPERKNNLKKFLDRRKDLRNHSTPQEIVLWSRIKDSALGYKFRRQHSIGGYILDFYCPSKMIGIEIDGSQHQTNKEYDLIRDTFLKNFGVKVLRFWNDEVNKNLEGVVLKISTELQSTTP